MRNRLIELLKDAMHAWDCYLSMCFKINEVPNVGFEEFLADCLLQDGVIVENKDDVKE